MNQFQWTTSSIMFMPIGTQTGTTLSHKSWPSIKCSTSQDGSWPVECERVFNNNRIIIVKEAVILEYKLLSSVICTGFRISSVYLLLESGEVNNYGQVSKHYTRNRFLFRRAGYVNYQCSGLQARRRGIKVGSCTEVQVILTSNLMDKYCRIFLGLSRSSGLTF